MQRPERRRTVLLNPLVEAAVLETARGGILTGGLGFDQCDVAVVTNLGGGDHIGSHGVETLEEMAAVKATVLRAVAPAGIAVLNAGDPMVGAMAEASPAPVIYFCLDGDVPLLLQHRQRGGRAAFVRSGVMVWAEGDAETELVSLTNVPLTHEGRLPFQVENALAAAAAVLALGIRAKPSAPAWNLSRPTTSEARTVQRLRDRRGRVGRRLRAQRLRARSPDTFPR